MKRFLTKAQEPLKAEYCFIKDKGFVRKKRVRKPLKSPFLTRLKEVFLKNGEPN